ncbi:MAG: hypothetical protein M5U34_39105 [Chloroflexi bacterium]|nr:hypothetical protein [Chloroflexota bacterium]
MPFGPFSFKVGEDGVFVIEIGLVYLVHWLIGPGGIWLVSLPLVVLAVEHLSGGWRWLVYGAVLGGMILPLGRSLWHVGGWFLFCLEF